MSDKPTYEELEQEIRELKKVATEHEQIEQALNESEAKLKEAQKLGRMGHWEFDLDSQRLMWSPCVRIVVA